MKKLSMFALIMLLAASAVSAHDGSLGLYTSQAATDCDADFNPFNPMNVYLMYYRSDGGPDGITGAELMVELSSAQVTVVSFTENPNTLTNGSILAGIGIVFTDDCFGAGQSYILLGTLSVMSLGATPGWTMKVLGDPRSEVGDGLNVSMCGGTKPMVPVLGGWFYGQDGACNVGTEPATWGAVKSMYNN
ncbi:MAG TPA: hypothetical protein VLA34_06130 [Candidatus Krumholzibacterium sp.]|nr:hypothetical protein [Candidatus Krumholzibacterium sp.]